MPKNTPLPMQWLTVDGQNVPIVLPEHWDGDKKEWKTTGTGNPLPVANYTQNASGVWLPTSESNPVPTQLTGSNVERVVLVDGAVLTDTSENWINISNHISNANNISFAVRNTLTKGGEGVNARISLRTSPFSNVFTDLEQNQLFSYIEIPHSTFDTIMVTDKVNGWEMLNEINAPTIYLYYRARDTVDEGSLTIYLYKKTGGLKHA